MIRLNLLEAEFHRIEELASLFASISRDRPDRQRGYGCAVHAARMGTLQ
jgi:hypothetical protein